MGKKNKNKKLETTATQEKKQDATSVAFIDDLFASKATKKRKGEDVVPDSKEKDSKQEKPTKKPKNIKPSSIAPDDDFFDSRGTKSKRKTTEEGFMIYSSKELNIGQGEGDTEDCPFDCQCCF
ncbi:hypothetical protein DSO57_1019366 [Entomophthora muscae]|uniref:Uncharacterized protein n=1 Tax=Entomophthora muscae TaxID=34485 RepID=A0ACC2U2Q6_9FUNG|nr:hypothetical protein DSO57_1019366 [Entomophthora muscae]